MQHTAIHSRKVGVLLRCRRKDKDKDVAESDQKRKKKLAINGPFRMSSTDGGVGRGEGSHLL